jgi:PIN domain
VQASEETIVGAESNESVSNLNLTTRGTMKFCLSNCGGEFGKQRDRNTENDIKIRDCCRFFQQARHEPVYLLSGDVNLCIRGQSDGESVYWKMC